MILMSQCCIVILPLSVRVAADGILQAGCRVRVGVTLVDFCSVYCSISRLEQLRKTTVLHSVSEIYAFRTCIHKVRISLLVSSIAITILHMKEIYVTENLFN
jgi:hypothetical protein